MLFSNSCSSDNTVTIFENAKDSRSMFKFNSFRFQRQEKVSTVWLHCEVQVCDGEMITCQPVSVLLFNDTKNIIALKSFPSTCCCFATALFKCHSKKSTDVTNNINCGSVVNFQSLTRTRYKT